MSPTGECQDHTDLDMHGRVTCTPISYSRLGLVVMRKQSVIILGLSDGKSGKRVEPYGNTSRHPFARPLRLPATLV